MSPTVFMACDFCFSTALPSSRFISYWNKKITSTSRGHLPSGQSQSFEIHYINYTHTQISHIYIYNTRINSVTGLSFASRVISSASTPCARYHSQPPLTAVILDNPSPLSGFLLWLSEVHKNKTSKI